MVWIYVLIIISGLTSVGFISKLGTKKGISALDLTTSLFAISSAIGFVTATANKSFFFTPNVIIISIFAGAGGSIAFFLFNHALTIGHYGFSFAIYRSSFILPVIFSILFLNEPLKSSNISGILFIAISLFLISYSAETMQRKENSKNPALWLVIITASFILSGFPRISQAMISSLGENSFSYIFLSYFCGMVLLVIFNLIKKSFNIKSLLYGIGSAAGSYLSVYFTIKSLKLLPSAVVFPITLSGPIILGVMLSLLIFKEKIKAAGYIGIALGIAGIAVLYLW